MKVAVHVCVCVCVHTFNNTTAAMNQPPSEEEEEGAEESNPSHQDHSPHRSWIIEERCHNSSPSRDQRNPKVEGDD